MMRMSRGSIVAALAILLAACSRSAPPPSAEQGIFGIQAESSSPGEAQVRVRSLPTAGTVVTVVSQLRYDPARLKVKDCAIGAGASVGKQLQWAEPQAGLVTAVVAGGLQPLPPESELMSCTFSVVRGAPKGAASVSVRGDVAEKPYEERPFSADSTVVIDN
jgi:hypothetical protein